MVPTREENKVYSFHFEFLHSSKEKYGSDEGPKVQYEEEDNGKDLYKRKRL